jgi:predicted AAA+ superfamily ATPase
MDYLHELASSYLIKDILAFEGIQKSKKIIDLLILLAFQIGKEVSHTELGSQLQLSRATVEKYLDLLEQTFVLVNIRGFSRNLRKEVTKTSRYYFCDLGIRNALINNFNPLSRRSDVGELWENYLVMERIKKQEYQRIRSNNYFWRTYDQKEIDWVEEREGKLFGYEFKWSAAAKPPKLWLETYVDASFESIYQSNYLPFIT